MPLMDFLSKQFIDIIEWVDDSRDTLSFRFPDQDKEIKRGAQLIVRESQIAQFVYLGQFGDTFGPGKHELVTDNIPILSDLKGWKYGFESPFKADVYYVVTRLFTGNKWGTANPVMMRDKDFGIVRMRAYGIFDFQIVDPKPRQLGRDAQVAALVDHIDVGMERPWREVAEKPVEVLERRERVLPKPLHERGMKDALGRTTSDVGGR